MINITVEHETLTLDSFVLLEKRECRFSLRFTTMKGDIVRRAGNVCIGIPDTRQHLPDRPTLRDVVLLALRRQHPVYQYVAEQNGVVVESYFERWDFAQSMGRITYGIETNADGQAVRFYP